MPTRSAPIVRANHRPGPPFPQARSTTSRDRHCESRVAISRKPSPVTNENGSTSSGSPSPRSRASRSLRVAVNTSSNTSGPYVRGSASIECTHCPIQGGRCRRLLENEANSITSRGTALAADHRDGQQSAAGRSPGPELNHTLTITDATLERPIRPLDGVPEAIGHQLHGHGFVAPTGTCPRGRRSVRGSVPPRRARIAGSGRRRALWAPLVGVSPGDPPQAVGHPSQLPPHVRPDEALHAVRYGSAERRSPTRHTVERARELSRGSCCGSTASSEACRGSLPKERAHESP
jgi:hypothetical protein